MRTDRFINRAFGICESKSQSIFKSPSEPQARHQIFKNSKNNRHRQLPQTVHSLPVTFRDRDLTTVVGFVNAIRPIETELTFCPCNSQVL